jgi:transposase
MVHLTTHFHHGQPPAARTLLWLLVPITLHHGFSVFQVALACHFTMRDHHIQRVRRLGKGYHDALRRRDLSRHTSQQMRRLLVLKPITVPRRCCSRCSPGQGAPGGTLATTVNSELFSVELDAFARAVGAGPTKQIVLILDGAGWHDSPQVQVPDHVHLLFLPPHSPELQPAEHLWPLTNTVLVNQHFASIEELEDAQAERCAALQGHPDLIRSATRFSWWPQRIHRRHGPQARSR